MFVHAIRNNIVEDVCFNGIIKLDIRMHVLPVDNIFFPENFITILSHSVYLYDLYLLGLKFYAEHAIEKDEVKKNIQRKRNQASVRKVDDGIHRENKTQLRTDIIK